MWITRNPMSQYNYTSFVLCQHCYGQNFSGNLFIPVGKIVGNVAAQSRRRPRIQLMLQIFHVGGVFCRKIGNNLFRSINGTVSFLQILIGRLIYVQTKTVGFLIYESSWIDLTCEIKHFKKKGIKFSSRFVRFDKKFNQKLYWHKQKIFFPNNTFLLLRHSQWVIITSNIRYLKLKRPLFQQDLYTNMFRTQNHRELLFEEISLKRWWFIIFKKIKIVKNLNLQTTILPNIFIKLSRVKDLSYALLRRIEPINNKLRYIDFSLFFLKYNDFITTQQTIQITKEKSFFSKSNKRKTNSCLILSQRLFLSSFYKYLFIKRGYNSFLKRNVTMFLFRTKDPSERGFFNQLNLQCVSETEIKYNKKFLQSLNSKKNQGTFNRLFAFSRHKTDYILTNQRKIWFSTKRYTGFKKLQLTTLTIKVFPRNTYLMLVRSKSVKKNKIDCWGLLKQHVRFYPCSLIQEFSMLYIIKHQENFSFVKMKCEWALKQAFTSNILWTTKRLVCFKVTILLKNRLFINIVDIFVTCLEKIFLFYETTYTNKTCLRDNACKLITCPTKNFIHFFTLCIKEVYQNFILNNLFLLKRNCLQIYIYLKEKQPRFMARWISTPIRITGTIRLFKWGTGFRVDRNKWFFRDCIHIPLKFDAFFPWPVNSLMSVQSSLRRMFNFSRDLNNTTFGVFTVRAIFNIYTNLGLKGIMTIIYMLCLKRGILNKTASQKALHVRQRILVD